MEGNMKEFIFKPVMNFEKKSEKNKSYFFFL